MKIEIRTLMIITALFAVALAVWVADPEATLAGFSYDGEILSRVACFFVMIAVRLLATSAGLTGFRHVLFSILVPWLVTLVWFYSVIFATGRDYRFYNALHYLDDPFIILAEYAIAFAITEGLRQAANRIRMINAKKSK